MVMITSSRVTATDIPFTGPLNMVGDKLQEAVVAARQRAQDDYINRRNGGVVTGHRVIRPIEQEIFFHYVLGARYLGDALDRAEQFYIMLSERFHNGYVRINAGSSHTTIEMKFEWDYNDDARLKESSIMNVIDWFNFFKWAIATDIRVTTIGLPFIAQEPHRNALAPLGAQIKCELEHFEIRIPKEYLSAPIVKSTDDLDQFYALTDLYLRVGFVESGNYSHYVKKIVLSTLSADGTMPSLSKVAGILKQSPSTLKRRLSSVDYRYKDIIAECRFESACALLMDTSIPIKSVANLLGYLDHNAFRRAFKQWSGVQPAKWRAIHTPAQEPSTASSTLRTSNA